MKIKICGMKFMDNIRAVEKLKPDYIGFIFYKKSKRYVGEELTKEVFEKIDKSIHKVGVFVNEEINSILRIKKKFNFDYIQLHGDESPEYCKILQEKGCLIIKSFSIDDQFDFNLAHNYSPFCHYFLFDTKGKKYGGNGETFNWSLLNNYQLNIPFFLSGGIEINNISGAFRIKNKKIIGLDLNSKLEQSPGIKDIQKVKSVITKIRNYA